MSLVGIVIEGCSSSSVFFSLRSLIPYLGLARCFDFFDLLLAFSLLLFIPFCALRPSCGIGLGLCRSHQEKDAVTGGGKILHIGGMTLMILMFDVQNYGPRAIIVSYYPFFCLIILSYCN